MAETMMAAQHQYHRKNNKRQVIQKQKARLEAGYWSFGSKRGYQMVKDAVHGKISIPKEPDATFIREAVDSKKAGYRTDKLPCAVRLFEDFVTSIPKMWRYGDMNPAFSNSLCS